ncbi:MAG: heparinase II/III family protein [Anaerolineae bacterium]|nr:heparinase II/III family protein [Anaerolineae bacterium]
MRFYRNAGNGLVALAFVCAITEEDPYCDLAKTYLLTYAGWEQWSERSQRDLSLAHMLYGSALAYDWLYNRLSPDEQNVVRQSLAKWAQRMYEASTQRNEFGWRNWWHKSYLQNHYWVNNSALGMAGLALINDGFLVAQCTIFPAGDTAVNIRAWSSSTSEIIGTLAPGQSAVAIGQMEGTDDHAWWHLAEEGWVRSDVVRGAEDCQAGPLDPQLWIDQAQDRLALGRLFLEGIEDGSWHEGFNYQGYLLTMSLPFWIAMRDLTGIDLMPHTYLRNYTYWWLYNYLPDASGVLLSFGNLDAGWVNNRPLYSVLRFNAQEYGDGHAEWLTEQIIAALGRDSNVYTAPWYVFEYLVYDPTIAPQPPTDLPGSRTFPDLSAVIWRTGWAADDLIFGLKTGVHGGQFAFNTFVEEASPWETPCRETHCQLNVGHDHEDTNSFYIYQNGWLAPEDSEVGRHDTPYHNTLLIDGEGQSAPPSNRSWRFPEDFADSEGFLKATADSAHFNFLVADATQRYSNIEGLQDVTRYVLFIRPDYLVMFDRIEANAPHQVEWVVHLEAGASVEGTWIRGNGDNGQLLGIGFAAPQPFVATMGADAIPYVRVRPESPSDSVLFASVLYPTVSEEWDARPTLTLMDRTSEAVVLHLQPHDASQRVIDVVLSFDKPQSPIEIGPYRFDGRIAVVGWGPGHTLERLFIYDGTFLTDTTAGDQTLIEGLGTGAVFEAVFGGSAVSVFGNLSGAVTLFAPATEEVTLNGRPHSFLQIGAGHYFLTGVERAIRGGER